jgi:hypothetical protein
VPARSRTVEIFLIVAIAYAWLTIEGFVKTSGTKVWSRCEQVVLVIC